MSSRAPHTQMERFSAIPGISASDICVCALTRPGITIPYSSPTTGAPGYLRLSSAYVPTSAIRSPEIATAPPAISPERPHRQHMACADQRNGLAHRVSFAYRRQEMAQFSTHPTRKNKMIPMTVSTVTVANRPAVSPAIFKVQHQVAQSVRRTNPFADHRAQPRSAPSPRATPKKFAASADGSAAIDITFQGPAPNVRSSRINSGFTALSPSTVFTATGKKHISATVAAFGTIVKPNQSTRIGATAGYRNHLRRHQPRIRRFTEPAPDLHQNSQGQPNNCAAEKSHQKFRSVSRPRSSP